MRPTTEALRAGALALLTTAGMGQAVIAQEYHVDRSAANEARFVSRMPIEEFEGVTDRIDGYVLLDGGGVRAGESFDGAELYFEVDLASLDTGIGRRNRHMRDNYLEVAQYPYATFAGNVERIERASTGWSVTSSGTFTVHGVGRARTLTCLAEPVSEGFRVSCAFVVLLPDHDIGIPRIMFLKLAEEIRVEVAFYLDPAENRP